MRIRIQPRDLEVPEKTPFRHDLLNRRESVEILTQLVGTLDGPCVFAVDAAWGNGKTAFLRMWAQHLRNQEFPVVEFNAWETDFSDEPFVALSSELTRALEAYTDDALKQKVKETKLVAKKLLTRAVPSAIRLVTAGILDISPLLETEAGKTLASFAEDRLSAYEDAQQCVYEFRKTLQDLAEELSRQKKDLPLIVMIDELDRCRPSYAVELLEVAKHLFSVDRIVFVLAVNRSELVHSIKALYGGDFDAQGYLHRFFDVDYDLPEPPRNAFVLSLFDALQIGQYFDRNLSRWEHGDAQDAQMLLLIFFATRTLSLRQIAQAMHRLTLALASLRSDQRPFAITTVVMLILRSIDAELYHRFCRREVSDRQLIDRVFDLVATTSDLRISKQACYFEATIIMATNEMAGISQPDLEHSESPLLQHYRELVETQAPVEQPSDANHRRAREVIKIVDALYERVTIDETIGFKEVVQRIELLSPNLVERSE